MSDMFYVYAYLDPRKPGVFTYNKYKFDYEPFYVGKGSGDRINFHLCKSAIINKHKANKINKIKKECNKNPIVIKIKDNLSEKKSLQLETILIKAIGRNDLQKGPLTNLTNGGDGVSGLRHSAKYRKYLSDRNKRLGINSKFMKASHKASEKWWIVLMPNGSLVKIKNLNKFCKDNLLTVSAMYHTAECTLRHRFHKKFACVRLSDFNSELLANTYLLTKYNNRIYYRGYPCTQ